MKHLLLVPLGFLFACSPVSIVFGNPIPWDPVESFLHLDPIQYFSIIVSEFCGLLVGTAILIHFHKAQWQKATLTILIALIISYALGIAIWTLAYQNGILTYNPNTLNTIILSLPEFIGIAIGTVIIQKLQKTRWKTAFIAITAAMLTSLLVGMFMANMYLN